MIQPLSKVNIEALKELSQQIKGDLFYDETMRLLYATDASAYREIPLAVARPLDARDIKALICFAHENLIPLIPRTAGTSLAGQVVGSGLVVDMSKYMTNIIELNEKEKWIIVQPGVVLDELNKYLEKYGLFFGPETSTSTRCMIGGMVGNNSCGAHSLVYGSAREHTLEVKAFLTDGTEVVFKSLSKEEFANKCIGETFENKLYRQINEMLSTDNNKEAIRREFPDPDLERRNTGYAIDMLLESAPFTEGKPDFNFCSLIAGSEGTLAFITEIKLNLVPLPPKETALVCVHLNSVEEALEANLIALKHQPVAIELMDDIIMNCTKDNIEQNKNRFFVQGDPGALLIVEFAKVTQEEVLPLAEAMETEMRAAGYGYHFPVLFGNDIKKVWALRKAGLGLLSNIVGDKKAVPVIEDTAVKPELLPEYIRELKIMLNHYGLSCVYYAHIATGELHLRPVLNLKDNHDVELFHTVALETAKLVKKYRGSISGEHGDGRLRGEFIPMMIGLQNYQLLKEIKKLWDPLNIFNPGKITDTPQMNAQLRYEPDQQTREFETVFDFSSSMGMLREAEKCNGSGDCRKSEIIGGTMCPSYMATRDENCTTRSRANILREYLTRSPKQNPFSHKEIYEVMDLCLSCKGCKSECPSSVDMAKLKAEFLQHYYDANGVPLRSLFIGYNPHVNKLGSLFPSLFNFAASNKYISLLLKKLLSFAPERNIPLLYKTTLRKWAKKHCSIHKPSDFPNGKVFLFVDEFTEYNDTQIGIKAIQLLNRMGYYVELANNDISGRTFISKGLIRKAKNIAIANVSRMKDVITAETPLVGIEPSGVLSFRDEYPDLVGSELKASALELSKNCLMFDEFISRELDKGKIDQCLFAKSKINIKLHGHCHQKSIASIAPTKKMLEFIPNYNVEEIKSGCCGMAGAFGYEKEHYSLSMLVGELVLFPNIRQTPESNIIAAPGTSCRHQIKDGTGRTAYHPIEIMYDALV